MAYHLALAVSQLAFLYHPAVGIGAVHHLHGSIASVNVVGVVEHLGVIVVYILLGYDVTCQCTNGQRHAVLSVVPVVLGVNAQHGVHLAGHIALVAAFLHRAVDTRAPVAQLLVGSLEGCSTLIVNAQCLKVYQAFLCQCLLVHGVICVYRLKVTHALGGVAHIDNDIVAVVEAHGEVEFAEILEREYIDKHLKMVHSQVALHVHRLGGLLASEHFQRL